MDFLDNISLQQMQLDLKFLNNYVGDVYDFCGSICNCELFTDLILGKKSRKEVIYTFLESYFEGYILTSQNEKFTMKEFLYSCESSQITKRVLKIKERYLFL